MTDLRKIAAAMGGEVTGNVACFPTPGHPAKDRGSWASLVPGAPDGVLVHCANGGDPLAIKDELRAKGVLPEREQVGRAEQPRYWYTDASGNRLYAKVRVDRPGAKYCLDRSLKNNGIKPVPYRLADLASAPADAVLYMAEGEKHADKLASWGLLATSLRDWRHDYAQHVAGRTVVILPDNDAAGAEHADKARKLVEQAGGRPVLVDLPGLPPKGDVMDWRGDRAELERLAEVAMHAPPAANDTTPGVADASEDAIALDFTRRYRDTLRFDHDLKAWFQWDGTRWQQDGCSRAFHYARTIGRELGKATKEGTAIRSAAAGGAERFARADPAHAVRASHWDCDPLLLGTPGGTVDLRTGKMFTPRPGDAITKLAGVTPESGTPELWLRFLSESLNGEADAIRFVQQWLGYCLTGDTREHALAFAHGPGGNGKSVWLNTATAIMGDYAATATMETFTASRNDRHSTELAMLRGARLVTASETEEGRAWAEARIKALTGGDFITARLMFKDNFTFRPQFKLTIAGNHAPKLANVDDAMRRRFNILPFVNKPANPDRQLEDKLKAEHGRILAWAIDGCLDWQRNGLVRPAAVQAATAEYFEGEDLLGQWLSERCEIGPSVWELPARLYSDWKDYATANGEAPGTNTDFGKKLTAKGYPSKPGGSVRKRIGLTLRAIEGGFDER